MNKSMWKVHQLVEYEKKKAIIDTLQGILNQINVGLTIDLIKQNILIELKNYKKELETLDNQSKKV